MLQFLRIRHLALLEEASLEFDRGFTVVTGETGAGKSILLGALSLLAGSRADKTLIRQGCESCEVEAGLHFPRPESIDAALLELGLPSCEEGVLLLRRTLSRKRLPQVQINGRLTTLANLQALGQFWIDFHGPGEPQKLFHEKWQLELLDLFAGNARARREYAEAFQAWKDKLKEAEALARQEALDPEEAEFLRRQVASIDAAAISPEAVETLERDYLRLSRSQDLINRAQQVAAGLGRFGDGVGTRLGALLQVARDLARIDPSNEPLASRLESAIIELGDLADGFGAVVEGCEFDQHEQRRLEERMTAWMGLKRRYGGSAESVLSRRDAMARRLSQRENVAGELDRLQHEAETLEQQARRQAGVLRESRQTAAGDLARAALRLISRMGFAKARLSMEVVPEPALREQGDSSCRFLFAPNPGQPLLPLSKIASSGEVARVMLGLKAVLAEVDSTPVLVFDEVDANIGGEIAVSVARQLALLGQSHQVFCVTHLPQVAARANHHLVVEKTVTDLETAVSIRSLEDLPDQRVSELARMLGNRGSSVARAHAEALLQGCDEPPHSGKPGK